MRTHRRNDSFFKSIRTRYTLNIKYVIYLVTSFASSNVIYERETLQASVVFTSGTCISTFAHPPSETQAQPGSTVNNSLFQETKVQDYCFRKYNNLSHLGCEINIIRLESLFQAIALIAHISRCPINSWRCVMCHSVCLSIVFAYLSSLNSHMKTLSELQKMFIANILMLEGSNRHGLYE